MGWTEGMTQPDLEAAVEVGGFGYPALVVISQKKMKYSMLTGSFSYEGINEFLRDLSYGKGRTNPVRGAKMPKIATVEAWESSFHPKVACHKSVSPDSKQSPSLSWLEI